MKSCFGDTSYFLALLVPTDVNHAAARQWARSHREPIVTSEYVVVEVGNYLSPPATRRLFGHFVDALRSDRRISFVPASPDLLQLGIDRYRARKDKAWSLTDCTFFVIMQQHGITDALTADRHFEQAGFATLLRQEA